MTKEFPGMPPHQKLLHAIVSYYAGDPRILAVLVFGSLVRGNWDRYSDLDLDIIIADGLNINVIQELKQLCDSFAAIGERAALIVPDRDDAGDVVLASLMELSVRYHPLATTSPNIVSSMQVLSGQIDREVIRAAGLANRRELDRPLTRLVDMYVRYAVGVEVNLHRKRLWRAVEAEHRMRALLMELFACTRGGIRPLQFFQAEASADLQARLGAALPKYDLLSLQSTLLTLLDILEQELEQWTMGQVQLTEEQREVLKEVRKRQGSQD